jgi:hypothetical protein
MATLYGVNADKRLVDSPQTLIDPNANGGRLRVAYDEHTFDGNPSNGDVIKMMTIPKGAKLYQAILVVHAALDTSATDLDVGWDGGANGDETADEDGIFGAVDAGTGALIKRLVTEDADTTAPNAAYGKEFADEVQIEISLDADLDAADGDKISLEVHYSYD